MYITTNVMNTTGGEYYTKHEYKMVNIKMYSCIWIQKLKCFV